MWCFMSIVKIITMKRVEMSSMEMMDLLICVASIDVMVVVSMKVTMVSINAMNVVCIKIV